MQLQSFETSNIQHSKITNNYYIKLDTENSLETTDSFPICSQDIDFKVDDNILEILSK